MVPSLTTILQPIWVLLLNSRVRTDFHFIVSLEQQICLYFGWDTNLCFLKYLDIGSSLSLKFILLPFILLSHNTFTTSTRKTVQPYKPHSGFPTSTLEPLWPHLTLCWLLNQFPYFTLPLPHPDPYDYMDLFTFLWLLLYVTIAFLGHELLKEETVPDSSLCSYSLHLTLCLVVINRHSREIYWIKEIFWT